MSKYEGSIMERNDLLRKVEELEATIKLQKEALMKSNGFSESLTKEIAMRDEWMEQGTAVTTNEYETEWIHKPMKESWEAYKQAEEKQCQKH